MQRRKLVEAAYWTTYRRKKKSGTILHPALHSLPPVYTPLMLLAQDNMGQTAKEEDVVVSRVELDRPDYHHRKHWQESVLPRLYGIARMVYRFRGDDMLRFRYLLASPVRDYTVGGHDVEAALRRFASLACMSWACGLFVACLV